MSEWRRMVVSRLNSEATPLERIDMVGQLFRAGFITPRDVKEALRETGTMVPENIALTNVSVNHDTGTVQLEWRE